MSGSSDRDQALLALQKKYDDALDHTLTLQLQIQDLEKEKNKNLGEIDACKSLIEIIKSQNQELEQEIAALKRTIDNLQNDSNASNSQLLDKLRGLEAENANLQSKLKMLQG